MNSDEQDNFNLSDDIDGGIEGILKAFFPNILKRDVKSPDKIKVSKSSFEDYRIKYFTKKVDDGFECHINLSNIPCKDKTSSVKNLSLKYIPKNKLLIGFYYGNIYIEDILILGQKITPTTALKGYETKNDILVISFKK